ncbi:prestalk protein-like [Polypterus senegalus]|uniref:prestalk protein-like n=1 Tax=Polypterus senegalus TaxID=55291 RepID=UPI001966439B|nr:prestalk protein-like [Polypterus senegalus]
MFQQANGGNTIGGCISEAYCAYFDCCQGNLCNKPNPSPVLTCYQCSNLNESSSCDVQQLSSCSSPAMQCGVSAIQTIQNSLNQTQYIRSCVNPAICNVSMSINTGELSAVSHTECCQSNLCNSNSTEVITPSPNTLQCHSATSNVDQVVQCAGIEDRCFTLGISGLGLVQGCASQSACDNVQMIADYFGFTTISNISCCQGSFCNNATNNSVRSESCNVSVSLNYGYGSTAWISQCCSSDLCNAENVSVASDPNGLVCCAGLNGLCQRLVMCTGIQDHCFISDTGLSAYSGCASQSVCDNPVTAAASLQISLSQQTHCCQGNVCNKPNVTLSCYVCQSSPSWDVCENTTTSCDSENSACGVFVNVNSSGLGVTNSETERSCVTLDRCNTTESTNYGLASSIWTSHCCDTDLCNTETVVSNTSGVINGLLCCATTDGTCQNAVQCTGVEDNCFTSDDGQNVYRGCTSQSVCNDPPHSLTARSWPFMSNSRCCQGNLCNRPDTLTCNNCYATSWTTCESHAEVCPQGDMYCVSSAYSYVTLAEWFSPLLSY